MGASANVSAAHTLAGQGSARPAVLHELRPNRLYAHVGPPATMLTGSSNWRRLDPLHARTQLWFRERQFLFTISPFITKE